MANLAPLIRQRFFDDDGAPLNGGKLFSYIAGTDTEKVTYSSPDLTENTNPIVLDADGYADVWLASGSYKFVLKDSLDNTIWTKDNISNSTVENGFSTGDVKLGFKTVADTGWVMMDDKTIGSASSGATGRANDDTEALYIILWNNLLDAWAPVTSGRGASAAADFAANKPLKLPRTLGRALAVGGAGAGLTSRALGSYVGAETHALSADENGTHTHTQVAHSHPVTGRAMNSGDHFHNNATAPAYISTTGNGEGTGATFASNASTDNATPTNNNSGLGTAHNNMQPSTFFNVMIKL